MKIISLIGYSGSGKTTFILKLIRMLKNRFNYNIVVIKNIHEHQIDKEGKDTYLFSELGAQYSITKNINDETTIFIKKKVSIEELKNWIIRGPFKVDLIITEGFRDLEHPTVLCLKDFNELETQLTTKVQMISGLVALKKIPKNYEIEVPIVNIETNFDKFLKIFQLKE
ncbi:MAG: molybdopterin-guanine dinucleotide biosynthesis protein B [Candidatus Hermodarchaeota archaeon]